jgi:KDO2-lipid IV(A) lauroyltransferase
MIDAITGMVYLLGWKIVRLLPERSAYFVFAKIADRSIRKRGKSYLRLRANLAKVRPDISDLELGRLAADGMRSYLRYWCDAFRLPSWSHERLTQTVTVEGEEMFRSHVAEGKGVVVSLPHSGNWDHAGAFFSATGVPIISVAEKLKPDSVFRAFLRYRERIGMRIYSAADNVLPRLHEHLSQGEVVALVADRDLSRNGIEVDFFDGVAKMPSGPAILALQNNSYLMVAHVTYTSDGIHIKFYKPLTTDEEEESSQVRDLIQQSANMFANGIRQKPEDWHMLQKIWISK